MYTFCIAIIHFKRSHIENKFRQLDKFMFNLSMFLTRCFFSLQSPFSNWIVNIRLSITYLVYTCRVQSVAPPLGLAEVINKLIFNNLHNPPPTKYFDTIINPLYSKQLLKTVIKERLIQFRPEFTLTLYLKTLD